jgi:hypothetical protein
LAIRSRKKIRTRAGNRQIRLMQPRANSPNEVGTAALIKAHFQFEN